MDGKLVDLLLLPLLLLRSIPGLPRFELFVLSQSLLDLRVHVIAQLHLQKGVGERVCVYFRSPAIIRLDKRELDNGLGEGSKKGQQRGCVDLKSENVQSM